MASAKPAAETPPSDLRMMDLAFKPAVHQDGRKLAYARVPRTAYLKSAAGILFVEAGSLIIRWPDDCWVVATEAEFKAKCRPTSG